MKAIAENFPLAPLTTLDLGGEARYFVRATDDQRLIEALRWASHKGIPVLLLGGGSNVVIGDNGFDGLVVQVATHGVKLGRQGDTVRVHAAAGESWDRLVEVCVDKSLWGIECLSGIPGTVGATPIQNVGAYGQEIDQVLVGVRVLNRATWTVDWLPTPACDLSYRNSVFRKHPTRYVVLSVELSLGYTPIPPRYGELSRAVDAQTDPAPTDVRELVLRLRRAKSMVLDASDPNRRSAGSFFTNPVVKATEAEAIVRDAVQSGLVNGAHEVPQYPASNGGVKLAAGWLIERAGIHKGLRRNNVGVSTNHALALVHHGNGTTQELLALAAEIRDAVANRFGVELTIEPTLINASVP